MRIEIAREVPVSTCPECGAPRVTGLTCEEMCDQLFVWEYQDADLLAEHFLTVASYNLQHPAAFQEEAIVGLRAALIDRIDNGVSIQELRRRASAVYDGSKRVLKPLAERRPVLRRWERTIAWVYLPEQPAGAAERVRAWAASIRREM